MLLFAELFVLTFGLSLEELSTICVLLMALNGLTVIYYAARPLDWRHTALILSMAAGLLVAILFFRGLFNLSELSFAAWLILIALALLVVPVQMTLEQIFDHFSALLEHRRHRETAAAAAAGQDNAGPHAGEDAPQETGREIVVHNGDGGNWDHTVKEGVGHGADGGFHHHVPAQDPPADDQQGDISQEIQDARHIIGPEVQSQIGLEHRPQELAEAQHPAGIQIQRHDE